jgi:hypothetical protein
MQRLSALCPCCDRPLGISWDMWGKYYLCGACGFTAEDDDDLRGEFGKPTLSAGPDLTQVEAHPPRQTSARD